MENQCSVNYIFQLFESMNVLQPIPASSKGDRAVPEYSQGAEQKGQAASIATCFHLESCLSGHEVT